MKRRVLIISLLLIIIEIGCNYFINKQAIPSIKKNRILDVKLESENVNVNSELFEKYYKKANKIIKNMTLEEKIGQLFLVRYNDDVANEIKNYNPGGYILFARDFENETKDSIKNTLSNNQSKSNIPLIFGVDEEGGTVTRISRFTNFRSDKFKSPQEIYNEGGYELLKTFENEKADLLLGLGINLNLAPVADVSINKDDYIYDRSFGKNAQDTAIYIKNMITYSKDKGISSTLKHFPGYGNNIDTHTGIAIDNRTLESFESNDLIPFEAGISVGVPTILVSHNIVNCMDKDYPASLSNKIHQLLRNKLNFSGIIMTDDLAMDAVKSYAENDNAATLAINAGNDMIITTDFKNMYNELLESVKTHKIDKSNIDLAIKRIISWKLAYGLYK